MAHVRYPDPDLVQLFQSAMRRSERRGIGPLISALRTAEIVLPELRGIAGALESARTKERRWWAKRSVIPLGALKLLDGAHAAEAEHP